MSKFTEGVKQWFSVVEAAQYIQSRLKMPFSIEDLYSHANDELPMFIHASRREAQEVSPIDPFPHDYRLHTFAFDELPSASSPEIVGHNTSYGKVATITMAATLNSEKTTLIPLACYKLKGQTIEQKSGYFKIDLRNPLIQHWQENTQPPTTAPYLFWSPDGLVATDDDGRYWQFLNRVHGSAQPDNTPPSEHNVWMRTSDIERFIDQFSRKEAKETSERYETSLLMAIYALKEILQETSQGRNKTVYKSNASIIETLLLKYGDKKGISKRNLEKIFAAAQEKFNSSSETVG